MGLHQHTRQLIPWLLLVWVAFALRVVHIDFGLPHRLHPDEGPATMQITRALSGPLHLGSYHHGPLLRELGWVVVRVQQGITPLAEAELGERVIATLRGISLLSGTLTVVAVGALARCFLSPGWALLAAALFATSPIPVFLSKYGTPDSLLVLLFTVSLWLALRLRQHASTPAYVVAGVAAGLTVASKYNGMFVLAAVPVAYLLTSATRRPPVARALAGWVGGLALGLAMGFPLLPWEWNDFLRTTWLEAQHQFVRGHRGIRIEPRDYLYVFHFVRSIWPSTGTPLLLAMLAGLLVFFRHADKGKWVVLAVAVPYYVAMESVLKLTFSPERYVLPLLPLYCLAAAACCAALVDRLPRQGMARHAVALTLVIAVAAWPAYRSLRLVAALEPDTRVQCLEWLRAHVDRGAVIAIGGLTYFYPPLARAEFPGLMQFGRGEPEYWVLSSFDYDEAFTYPQQTAAAYAYYRGIFESQDLVFEVRPTYETFMFHNPTLKVFHRRAPVAAHE